MGGKARMTSLSQEARSQLAKQAANKRWGNHASKLVEDASKQASQPQPSMPASKHKPLCKNIDRFNFSCNKSAVKKGYCFTHSTS